MKKILKGCVVMLLMIAAFSSCNKSKKYSNRVGGNKWKVVAITINGSTAGNLPELLFKDCDIYQESCAGTWITNDGGRATFFWQFRDKGKDLEIANQTDHVHGFQDVKAAEQCIEFSGIYEVESSTRKSFRIKSAVTHGHAGQLVEMTLERKD
jgi:hypothetical protein